MEQLIEQIKPIEDYEGLYSISNYGYVLSEKRNVKLKPYLSDNGYLIVNLYINGVGRTHYIHHLVWDHFGDRPRDGRTIQVDHKKENKLICRIDNLQALTARDNVTKYHTTKQHSSDYVGVHKIKKSGKYSAHLCIGKKHLYLGTYDTEINASNEYQRALNEYNATGKVTITTPNKERKTSKYRGVHKRNGADRWIAQIKINKETIYLGSFKNEYDAHLAYQKRRRTNEHINYRH